MIALLAGGPLHRRPGRFPRPAAAWPCCVPASRTGRRRTKFQRVASVEELDQILKTATRPVMLFMPVVHLVQEDGRFTFADRRGPAGWRLPAAPGRRHRFPTPTPTRPCSKRWLNWPPGIIFFDATGAERTQLRVVGFQDAQTGQGSGRSTGPGRSPSIRHPSTTQGRKRPARLTALLSQRCRAPIAIIPDLDSRSAARPPGAMPAVPGSMSVSRQIIAFGTATALTRPCFVCKPVPGTETW